jgi:hypothetical protein
VTGSNKSLISSLLQHSWQYWLRFINEQYQTDMQLYISHENIFFILRCYIRPLLCNRFVSRDTGRQIAARFVGLFYARDI